ncbi:hypothetical protein ABTQ23_06240 [Celerinatantimonas sp. MCCC 1A17872]
MWLTSDKLKKDDDQWFHEYNRTFFFNSIEFSGLAKKYKCDFVFEMGFEANDNRYAYA